MNANDQSPENAFVSKETPPTKKDAEETQTLPLGGNEAHNEATMSFAPSKGHEVTLIDQACVRFEEAWRDGRQPRLEDFVQEHDAPTRRALLVELLSLEIELKLESIQESYASRFPDAADDVPRAMRHGLLEWDGSLRQTTGHSSPTERYQVLHPHA